MGTVLFTGFPGFLGSELLPRILERDAAARAACLVQSKFAGLASRRAAQLIATCPGLQGRIDILEGDITVPALGLPAARDLQGRVTEIYHLAAIYDLSVPREFAMKVNLEGTRQVLEFACGCSGLERLQYVSTCYVSGRHAGVFTEADLDRGQSFHNFYEETKFLAEVEVQKRMREGLPATIYRPAVVVGDSATGETQKYDGPYSVIRLLLKQPRVALLPMIGDPARTEVNLVPRDFVVDAMAWLSGQRHTKGQVYHLSDPHPLTVDRLVDELAQITGRRVLRIPMPLGLAKASVTHVPGVGRLIGVPAAALDYFVHPGRYVSAKTQAALEDSGVRCPRFSEYAANLVRFVRAHPEIGSTAMA